MDSKMVGDLHKRYSTPSSDAAKIAEAKAATLQFLQQDADLTHDYNRPGWRFVNTDDAKVVEAYDAGVKSMCDAWKSPALDASAAEPTRARADAATGDRAAVDAAWHQLQRGTQEAWRGPA